MIIAAIKKKKSNLIEGRLKLLLLFCDNEGFFFLKINFKTSRDKGRKKRKSLPLSSGTNFQNFRHLNKRKRETEKKNNDFIYK